MSYRIGAAAHDITGPAAELGMMGMANSDQKTAGILSRLYARTFVIEERGNHVAIVSADIWSCTLAVKQEVVRRLGDRIQDSAGNPVFTRDNVLISGTHTHSGPGGYSHYALYNMTILGFDAQNFECIVDGIVESISAAFSRLAPGDIFIKRGELVDCGKNRSLEAYNNNSDRNAWATNTDTQMILLKFVGSDGRLLGVLNWFPIHPTSMGEKNLLISGDNKGYASYLFEKEMRAQQPDFIAAFANSNCGDVSGNVDSGVPDGIHDIERMEALGRKQYQHARLLFESAGDEDKLPGLVNYAHTYVDMSNVLIGDDKRTFPAAIGVSMIAGSTEDSVNRFEAIGIREGLTKDDVAGQVFSAVVGTLVTTLDDIVDDLDVPDRDGWPTFQTANGTPVTFEDGHGAKPILLAHGLAQPVPLSPQIVPLQIVRIGDIALVATPGEFTTMAGRRLRRTVERTLFPVAAPDRNPQVIIVGYAGAYSGYVTTKEEYDMQHYEGASTLFGPHTLEAYQQEFVKLAKALEGKDHARVQVDPGPTPPDLSGQQKTLQTGVILDSTPLFQGFGKVINEVATRPVKGEEVVAKFWAGHPKNDLRTGGTFLQVQKRIGGKWITIATDNDPSTKFEWRRADSSREDTGVSLHIHKSISTLSVATVTWKIPEHEQADGSEYRLVHDGVSRTLIKVFTSATSVGAYSGSSSPFELRNSVGPDTILFRNMSARVRLSIYGPGESLSTSPFERVELWEEDTYLFKFEPSISSWNRKAQVRFEWGAGSQHVVLRTLDGGTLVKIKGVRDFTLE